MAGPLNGHKPQRGERLSPTARFAALAVVGSVLALLAALWIWTPVLTPSDIAACRPGGDDPSRGRAMASTSRSYEWGEWKACPPGRVCRVYAYDGAQLLAEKTYPEGARYAWVV